MNKDLVIFLSAMLFVVAIIVGPTIYFAEKEEEWLRRHHCKIIHQNPDEYVWEYDAALKMMQYKRHEGKKFYECDNGEWR